MFPDFYNRKKNENYTFNNDVLVSGNIIIPAKNKILRFAQTGEYATLFGDQWQAYKKTQLDSFSGIPITKDRLDRCLGELKDDLKGKLVLEAGCGAGRFTEVLLQKGARLVSADLSDAVEVNQENFPQDENHLVIQADINDMPFADETFDVVVCLGVIQHTPDSERTIDDLYKLVKKGGTLVIDHYSFNRSHYFRLAPLYRNILKKKSAEETIPYTQKLVKKYLPGTKNLQKTGY